MIVISDIEALLVTWVKTFTGFSTGKVIIAEDNGPKPDLPYITIRLGPMTPQGHECRSSPVYTLGTDTNAVKISGVRDLVVNFQGYGDNIYGVLDNLYQYICVENSIDLLATGGLALINQIAINNLTRLNDLEFEQRAQMDLLFRFGTQLENIDVGYIETISVTGEVKTPDKTINIDIDLT